MEEKSEITAIFNKYKDTFDDFINSSDIKFLNHPDFSNRSKLIDTKGSRNAPKFKDGLSTFSKKNCLDKDIPIMSLEPALKI